MASILRSHPQGWTPWTQEVLSICQHAGPANAGSTTGSQISEIGDEQTHWFTGSSNPCMSVYWPFRFESPHVYSGFGGGGREYTAKSYWWRREQVNRVLARKFGGRGLTFPDIMNLQNEVYRSCSGTTEVKRIEASIRRLEKITTDLATTTPVTDIPDSDYTTYWKTRNSEVGIASS